MVNELVLSQHNQPQIYPSIHQLEKAGVIIKSFFFHGDLGFKTV